MTTVRLHIDRVHVDEQFRKRYPDFAGRSEEIVERMETLVRSRAPEDWRFTESPTSRFFLVDEETCAKFLGLSYRGGEQGRAIVSEIREMAAKGEADPARVKFLIQSYIEDVNRPDLPIHHEIRTVYPRKKSDIAEEKRLAHQTRAAVNHTLPLAVRKIASRPNAVIGMDAELWVRQYRNWVGTKPGCPEYYLFHPLRPEGVDRGRSLVFSHTENGNLNRVDGSEIQGAPGPALPDGAAIPRGSGLRSENYWRVPTAADRRFIDLDFRVRMVWRNGEKLKAAELMEHCILGRIIEKARDKMYRN